LTAGQVHDSRKAVEILSELNIQGSNILADKAYGTREIREYIEGREADIQYLRNPMLKKNGNVIIIRIRKDILWNVFSISLNSSAE